MLINERVCFSIKAISKYLVTKVIFLHRISPICDRTYRARSNLKTAHEISHFDFSFSLSYSITPPFLHPSSTIPPFHSTPFLQHPPPPRPPPFLRLGSVRRGGSGWIGRRRIRSTFRRCSSGGGGGRRGRAILFLRHDFPLLSLGHGRRLDHRR